MSKRIEGKVCIVTGSAGGIGRGIAEVLASEGGKVIVADLNEAGGKETVEIITKAGGAAVFFNLNVADEANWQKIIEFCEKTYGKLDVLVNNAGIGFSKTILDMTLADLRKVMSVNLESVFLGTKYSAPVMKKNGDVGGSIVNISSNYIFIPSKMQAAYCASKSGVASMTKVAAIEFAPDHIRVNTIYPGFVATNIIDSNPLITGRKDEFFNFCAKSTLAGRVGKPVDIAYAVLFLASGESEWITGNDFTIDGGEVVKRTFYDDMENFMLAGQK